MLNQTFALPSPAAGVAGSRVVLHRVGRIAQGPVDSAVTARGGTFRFRFSPDSLSLYLVSARHHGIEYFSAAIPTDAAGRQPIEILVSDTSSNVPILASARHLVVAGPSEERTREIVDLVTLEPARLETRVSPDSLVPTWTGPLPPGVFDARLGESDFSPEAARIDRDSVFLFGPIAPGEKQLLLHYWIPADRSTLAIPNTAAQLDLYVEDQRARPTGGGIKAAESADIGGVTFAHWSAGPPDAAGSTIVLSLPASNQRARTTILVLVVLMTAALGLGGWILFRRRPTRERVAEQAHDGSSSRLIEALAQLDARYEGKHDTVPAEEWNAYLHQRERLKQRVADALALERRTR